MIGALPEKDELFQFEKDPQRAPWQRPKKTYFEPAHRRIQRNSVFQIEKQGSVALTGQLLQRQFSWAGFVTSILLRIKVLTFWGNKMSIRQIAVAAAAAVLLTGAGAFGATVNTTANVVFIVDESGSMGGAQDWLENTVIGNLDTGLDAAGVTTRRYGVVGFGNGGAGDLGRVVGGGLTDAAAAQTNLGALQTTGFFEDGYSAIDFAVNAFSYDAGAAINFILVTDEDRDNGNMSLTRATIETALTSQNILLNAVVSNRFSTTASPDALGVDGDGNGYVADGNGSYVTQAGGTVLPTNDLTDDDYSNLALATGGAAWNLDQLSAGGPTAISFADAFVDIKVQEIIGQLPVDPTPAPTPAPVPLPAGFPMLLIGIGGFAALRLRQRS